MHINCPNCNQKYKVSQEKVGKKIRCQGCETSFVVGELEGLVKKADTPLTDGKIKVQKPAATPQNAKVKVKTQSPSDEINDPLGRIGQPEGGYKKRISLAPFVFALLFLGLGAGGYIGYKKYSEQQALVAAEEERLKALQVIADKKLKADEAELEAEAQKLAEEKKLAEEEKRRLAREKEYWDSIAKQGTFVSEVVPVLEKYCTDCHDEVDQEGDLNLELFLEEKYAVQEPAMWENLAKIVSLEQMPPSKSKQPSTEERQKIINWVDSLTNRWELGELGKDPGRTSLHRLNKFEYNYTIRDLFGLQLWLVGGFPEDGAADSGFSNNADSLFLPTLLVENYIEAGKKIVDSVYSDKRALSRYLISSPSGGKEPEAAAKEVLTHWASKVYRRPVENDEVDKLVALAMDQMENKKTFSEAMKTPLFTMLISPNFLYRATSVKEGGGVYKIGDFELANRLSYFLWSSMPDRELFELANKGELSNDEVLIAQVKRMLQDEKAESLGMHFGGQWFGWEELRSAANPDENRFPMFDFNLRIDLYRESTKYFNNIVKNDGSIYDFLDSDYTFLNSRLASFYDLPPVEGNALKLVKLEDRNRGGVLGMGSVLTASSVALRSSPSIRGAYVLKEVLGETLPDAPMNVEPLADDDKDLVLKTARDSLIEHSKNPDCRSCHQEIDPIGFSLEAFDAIGRFRTHQNGVELDTTGRLPDGTTFSGPAELKAALMNNKEQFAKNTASKLLTYALGRELSAYDRQVVKEVSDEIIKANGSMHTAIASVVLSYPFRNTSGENYKTQAEGN